MILAVFRSRAHSLDYVEELKRHGVGCGVCVRFEEVNYARAVALLRLGNYKSFKGFYKLEYVGGIPRVLLYTKEK